MATVVFDFDGVIHSYKSGWLGETVLEDPEPGAKEAIQSVLDWGYEVVIQSTRARTVPGKNAILFWLEANGFPEVKDVTAEKVPAVAYVDDRAVPYEPGSNRWNWVLSDIDMLATRGK